jgi:N-formylglutamate amidohydrolase
MNDFSLDYLNKLEYEFTLNNSNGADGPSFKVKRGDIPILISCPHSVNQIRDSRIKSREKYTGALSKLLHESTGTSLIYKSFNDGFDDNYILHTPYKDALGDVISRENIQLVLDLHGMVSSLNPLFRGYHIELGTDDTRNLLHRPYLRSDAIDIFKGFGIEGIVADEFFRASRPYTVSKYISTRFSTPAMQIEISSDYRDPNFGIENFKALVYSFERLIIHICKNL